MTLVQIPLTNQPNQTFTVNLPTSSGNSTLTMRVGWNGIAGYWYMMLYDQAGNLLLGVTPLVTGLNLMLQFQYLGLGNFIVLPIGQQTNDYPQLGDWGTNFGLLWFGS